MTVKSLFTQMDNPMKFYRTQQKWNQLPNSQFTPIALRFFALLGSYILAQMSSPLLYVDSRLKVSCQFSAWKFQNNQNDYDNDDGCNESSAQGYGCTTSHGTLSLPRNNQPDAHSATGTKATSKNKEVCMSLLQKYQSDFRPCSCNLAYLVTLRFSISRGTNTLCKHNF